MSTFPRPRDHVGPRPSVCGASFSVPCRHSCRHFLDARQNGTLLQNRDRKGAASMTQPLSTRVIKALAILTLVLIASVAVGLAVGSQRIHPSSLFSDSFTRTLFFRLRLPRV